jgi:integrase/recombinase XerD
LASIETSQVVGLRDRAIIATLIYTAACVGAVAKLRRSDYYADGHQWWFRFDEKGGKARTIPAWHDVGMYIEAYMTVAGRAPRSRGGERQKRVSYVSCRHETHTLISI